MSRLDLYLKRTYTEYGMDYLEDYYEMYDFVINDDLRKILAAFHTNLNKWFAVMNNDIRTIYDEDGTIKYDGGYFHAQDSRDYLSFEYWNGRSKEENETYPKYYEINIDLEIPGIQHGYLLVGGSYVGEILEDAVFEIIDITGKLYGASDELARELCEKLEKQCLEEKTPNNQEILSYIDKVDEFIQQKYAESKRTVLIANQKKLDNWLQLRKEEYMLRVKDTSELDELKEKYATESDFRQKIALKKQIENLEEQKQKMIEVFHDEMSTLEGEAANMQKRFEESILVKTQLVTKIVIKF